mmetsp:Transcript_12560/g.34739  ORF Transcript_12560/g.34739 Transcript_12560/m.34739 type:complete len:238 (-) Transcript_12560:272-985(-)
MLTANLAEFHCRLNHPLGRVAILEQDAFSQRAVIHADAQRLALLLQFEHQRRQGCLNRCLGLPDEIVSKFSDRVKRLPTVREVSWIHTNFVNEVCNLQRHLGSEVNVSNQRRGVAILKETLLDVLTGPRLRHSLHRQTDDIHPCISALLHLSHGCFHITRKCRSHCLCSYRVLGPNGKTADIDGPCFPSHACLCRLAVTSWWQCGACNRRPGTGHGHGPRSTSPSKLSSSSLVPTSQ